MDIETSSSAALRADRYRSQSCVNVAWFDLDQRGLALTALQQSRKTYADHGHNQS